MELINATELLADTTVGADTRGRERVVVVVKGTFDIPDGDGEARLSEEQVPLVEADQFTGEPAISSTLYEADFVPFKPRCDVVLHGTAYSPGGTPAKRVRVALNIGKMLKGFDVIGDRVWTKTLGLKLVSDPVPFRAKPISYDRAFGGVYQHPGDPNQTMSYDRNPVGVGYYPFARARDLEGKLLPNTAELEDKCDSPKGQYAPMSFGPVGRNFQPRTKLAGTYDERWLDEEFPFLPQDFDPSYFQCAPQDQQIPYPRGGELVVLRGLTPAGKKTFHLPRTNVSVELNSGWNDRCSTQAVMDTIVIEPDRSRLMITWRASQFLQRNIHEIREIIVGRMPQAWYASREQLEAKHAPPSPTVRVRPPEEPPVPPAEPAVAPPAEVATPAVEEPPITAPVAAARTTVAAPLPEPKPEPEPEPEPEPLEKTMMLSETACQEIDDNLTSTLIWDREAGPPPALLDVSLDDDEEEDLTKTMLWDLPSWDEETTVFGVDELDATDREPPNDAGVESTLHLPLHEEQTPEPTVHLPTEPAEQLLQPEPTVIYKPPKAPGEEEQETVSPPSLLKPPKIETTESTISEKPTGGRSLARSMLEMPDDFKKLIAQAAADEPPDREEDELRLPDVVASDDPPPPEPVSPAPGSVSGEAPLDADTLVEMPSEIPKELQQEESDPADDVAATMVDIRSVPPEEPGALPAESTSSDDEEED